MLCLGLAGGLNRVHENALGLAGAFLHDGAAVLVEDGRVIAAVEEERLNRIKHSNKFPALAIRCCLAEAGAELRDIDAVGFYATESYCNALLAQLFAAQPDGAVPLDSRQLLHGLLTREFGEQIAPEKLHFVPHHQAHAVSAFAMSGFDDSLILTIDGYGDFLSGSVAIGRGSQVTTFESFSQQQSLGLFYLEVVRFLGYKPFDEYKVMGLAPYGDRAVFQAAFDSFYELLADGGYRVHIDRIGAALIERGAIRRAGDRFEQRHCDVAAALQEALERIVLHLLRHRRDTIGQRNLCLAGGVAHNCTMNGKLLFSGMFDNIFVQPAAHDAGCALGAALMLSADLGAPAPREPLRRVYWGPDLAGNDTIEELLEGWGGFLDFERSDDAAEVAADLLAQGAVIGWVQGRSEFGPRALGNRSIVADPRPASNKDRINAMVKKREGYRPFAPSVLEEEAADYFALPPGQHHFPFMNFVVPVREDRRELLGAITHVDGTARIQTVARQDNPAYWRLIAAFKARAGVPIVLNTSFNNNAEPIVDSAEDAIVAFLTTDLDALVIGRFVARKRVASAADWLALDVSLPDYVLLAQSRSIAQDGRRVTAYEARTSFSARVAATLSPALFDALMTVDGACRIEDLLHRAGAAHDPEPLLAELRELWARRLVRLAPARVQHAPHRLSRVAADAVA